ncbi:hypothetical protein PAXINDRAFT_102332, partial [Paxillus involutus ATCC 200175]
NGTPPTHPHGVYTGQHISHSLPSPSLSTLASSSSTSINPPPQTSSEHSPTGAAPQQPLNSLTALSANKRLTS